MKLLGASILLLPYLTCDAKLPPDVPLDVFHEAEVDLDLRNTPFVREEEFSEEWHRELLALTALSRVDAAELLSIETAGAKTAWKRFRSCGIYEALFNMAKLTNFQMQNETFPTGWSMWGLEDSHIRYVAKTDRASFKLYRDKVNSYPFDPMVVRSWLPQAPTAFLMAAKWAVELKKVSFYNKPFFGLSETVEAYVALRDPTSYYKGGVDEGVEILRQKLIDVYPSTCHRQMRIAVAFDTYKYDEESMDAIKTLLDSIQRFTPEADITIRGTSKVSDGFPEGAKLDRFPRFSSSPTEKYFDILQLVESSIADIDGTEKGDLLRARVLLIISAFEDRQPDNLKARRLWTQMEALTIEPFYITAEVSEVKRNDDDLLLLLHNETLRGISSASVDSETMRLVLNRLLRLFCQVSVSIPSDHFQTIEQSDYAVQGLQDRIYLKHRPLELNERVEVNFQCLSHACQFRVYGHMQRHVNEYFYDVHMEANLTYNAIERQDFTTGFSDKRGGPIRPTLILMVVMEKACRVGVSLLPHPTIAPATGPQWNETWKSRCHWDRPCQPGE